MQEKSFPVVRVALWTPALLVVSFFLETLVDTLSVDWISYGLCWVVVWVFVGIKLFAGGVIEKTKTIEVRHYKTLSDDLDHLTQPYHLDGSSKVDVPTGECDYVEGDPVGGWVWAVVWPIYGLCNAILSLL